MAHVQCQQVRPVDLDSGGDQVINRADMGMASPEPTSELSSRRRDGLTDRQVREGIEQRSHGVALNRAHPGQQLESGEDRDDSITGVDSEQVGGGPVSPKVLDQYVAVEDLQSSSLSKRSPARKRPKSSISASVLSDHKDAVAVIA